MTAPSTLEVSAMDDVDLDDCAVPTPGQVQAMETGFGALFTPRIALELGMMTAIGNVKRALAKAKGSAPLPHTCGET